MPAKGSARIIIVPIDNRPVTYDLPAQIAAIAGLDVQRPPRQMMGSLSAPTDLGALERWLDAELSKRAPKALLICLDSLIYGGLIASRRGDETVEELLGRAQAIKRFKELAGKDTKIFAQSSIMRIPNYDDASEEPDYWAEHGSRIFAWSSALHREMLAISAAQNKVSDESALELALKTEAIPSEVRDDFLKRRWRNFKVNETLAEMAGTGEIDFLSFSQDDTGEYGFNVIEAGLLKEKAIALNSPNIRVYAGADEVILTLLARYLSTAATAAAAPKRTARTGSTGASNAQAVLIFSPQNGANAPSKYEGQTIGESLKKQMDAAAIMPAKTADAHFAVIVHTAGSVQGDHIHLPGYPDLRYLDTLAQVERTLELLGKSPLPCVLCDVAYANGADPLLIDALLKRPDLIEKLWGYGGWNTTGNAVGSALAMGVANWRARSSKGTAAQAGKATEAFKRVLFIRLVDDWAYQSLVRAQLDGKPDEKRLKELMEPYLARIADSIGFTPKRAAELGFPWSRCFEISVTLS